MNILGIIRVTQALSALLLLFISLTACLKILCTCLCKLVRHFILKSIWVFRRMILEITSLC